MFQRKNAGVVKSVYLSQELCKFYLTKNCLRGKDCNFSHDTKEFPCKYLHGTGRCEKGENCIFKHDLLNETEIKKFMQENEEFLMKVLTDTGSTNLAGYFLNYLEEKKLKEIEAKEPKNAMLPPSLVSNSSGPQMATD